jgi:hypothetical protein
MDLATISKQLEKYENKWVAIDESEEKIVGVGDDAFEATEDAERSGYQDTILFKVPSFDSAQPSSLKCSKPCGCKSQMRFFSAMRILPG